MSDLKLILDPGGNNLRPGLYITIYPDGANIPLESPSTNQLERSINGGLVASGFPGYITYQWVATIHDQTTQYKLKALTEAIEKAQNDYENFEIVIYNLAEPFSELGLSRTRYKVPDTDIINQQSINGQTLWTYWIALQGFLSIQKTGQYIYNFSFQESRILTKEME